MAAAGRGRVLSGSVPTGSGSGTLVLAAAGCAAFLSLAAAVHSGAAQFIDAWGMLALRDPADATRPFGPAWLVETGRDFTALGSNGVLGALVLAGSVLLVLGRRRGAAVFLAAAFCGALALQGGFKMLAARPRPGMVPHSALVFTSSFPSSHATVSAAVALAVAVLAARVRPGGAYGVGVGCAAGGVAGLVGLSRVYLGVHWPTDVAAGWALGVGWAAACWHVAGRRGG